MCGPNWKGAMGQGAGLLPSILVVLLPKCPLCIAAWAALFGSVGLDLPTYQRWVIPISALLLAASAWIVVRGVRGKRRIAVLSAVLAAIELILAGKLWLDSPAMTAAGSILFVGAALAVWLGRLREPAEALGASRPQV
ncbi:MAG TPA: hypothetical protein VHE55_09115 [Fimbriimonadaceae bacterium]|nr:hypothetical protein [Fimbriimonadaceae bacterium]